MNRKRTCTAKRCSVAGAVLVAALAMTSCGGGATPASSTSEAGVVSTAPVTDRVDLVEPSFSNPSAITNPLFPVSSLTQVVRVGADADGPLREESTLLPDTKIVEWNGQQIETVGSHFLSYSGRRILEAGVDYFAQADDGSVWSFGTEVNVYEDGLLVGHEGAWLAGRDGPPGMVMPANPQLGDVYRPENIPELVFEEVVVTSIDETIDGPLGPITGCLLIEERPMDAAIGSKLFAPGYAEFQAVIESESEVLTVSVGLPTDGLGGDVPADLAAMTAEAQALLRPISNWQAAAASVAWLSTNWESYRPAASPLTADQIDRALQGLRTGLAAQDHAVTHLAATDLAFAASDLRLRYESPGTVDLERMGILAERVQLDAADNAAGAVSGDVAAVAAIWSRVRQAVTDRSRVEEALADLIAAADATDLPAAATTAEQLKGALAQV